MALRYGLLDRSLKVERFTETEVTDSGTVQGEWKCVRTLRCAIIEQTKDEASEEFGDSSVETIRFRVPFVSDLTLADRVIFNGQPYDIRSITPLFRRLGLELTVRQSGG